MVMVKHECDCKTCKGSSRNDPAYAEMNKRIDAGEMVFGGYLCNCRCHQSNSEAGEKKGREEK